MNATNWSQALCLCCASTNSCSSVFVQSEIAPFTKLHVLWRSAAADIKWTHNKIKAPVEMYPRSDLEAETRLWPFLLLQLTQFNETNDRSLSSVTVRSAFQSWPAISRFLSFYLRQAATADFIHDMRATLTPAEACCDENGQSHK